MRRRRLLLAGLAAAVLVVTGVGPATAEATTPSIVPRCTPAGGSPTSCSGWFTTNLTLSWEVSNTSSVNCPPKLFSGDTAGTEEECTATSTDGQTTVTVKVLIKLDKTPPTVTGSAAVRGPDSNGWYNRPVSVSFAGSDATSGIASCTGATYAGPDAASAAVPGTCRDVAGNVSAPASFALKYDSTPPEGIAATPGRGADSAGWYNRPVVVAFTADDALSGIASCSSVTYAGPDAAAAAVAGSCEDRAGNRAARSLTLAYDATPPQVVSAAASRPPDSGEWYTKPVQFALTGSDATSGIDGCSAPSYSGPDTATAAASGTCRDRAGNTSATATLAFKYDANPPRLPAVSVRKARTFVTLSWQRSADATAYEVIRSPGAAGEAQTTLFRGAAASFRDGGVAANRKYRYLVRAVDDAGNAASRSLSVVARPPLYRPAAGARVGAPPVLAWEPVAGASYYNVQLWRGGRKVLSLWPSRPSVALGRTWVFAGKAQRLTPGRYRWYVWPGLGPRSKKRFGPLVGSSDFAVAR